MNLQNMILPAHNILLYKYNKCGDFKKNKIIINENIT